MKNRREFQSKPATPYRIDVHHHIIPPEYVKALAAVGVIDALGVRFPEWSVEKVIEMMDRNGIQTAVTSISSPAANAGDTKFARDLARTCNEFAAKLISDHPQRFGAFATLPGLLDVEGVLSEIEYALNTLKLDGIELLTNYKGKYLGDSSFEEIYQDLNRRKAVVHVHPGDQPGKNLFPCTNSLLEAPFETTRTITNLIYNGTLERYPNISFIFSHGGGTIPYLATRVGEGAHFWQGAAKNAPKGFYYYLKRLYYDTAVAGSSYALPSLHALVDNAHILFGTDYPFPPATLIAATVDGIASFDGFDAEGRRAIEEKNALALFPRLHAKRSG
jgi:predicted TIM-barrel fold metal-dependent hydrolase